MKTVGLKIARTAPKRKGQKAAEAPVEKAVAEEKPVEPDGPAGAVPAEPEKPADPAARTAPKRKGQKAADDAA
ncbi:hypothetical protein [Adlercreutzia muris]|uniref:hypothetical protein n=1 Tax=Adlercreutzia muris TaxID=1796610 RepID=UPI0013654FB1|nr:hypothetical protein [Adlercreutzia muris]NCA32127.1 hypothetical protein [Adlercreutzia muris]